MPGAKDSLEVIRVVELTVKEPRGCAFSEYLMEILKAVSYTHLSWPFGWSVATVLSCVFYFCGVWKKRCVVYTDPLALDEAAQAALSSPVCEMPLAEEDPIQ